jgi:arsenate reductase-like glutaredoxin family protein
LTGSVYEIPATQWSKKGDIYTFKNMMIYDAPIVVADKSVLLGFKAE